MRRCIIRDPYSLSVVSIVHNRITLLWSMNSRTQGYSRVIPNSPIVSCNLKILQWQLRSHIILVYLKLFLKSYNVVLCRLLATTTREEKPLWVLIPTARKWETRTNVRKSYCDEEAHAVLWTDSCSWYLDTIKHNIWYNI